ncbi:MAG TPA: YihY/virulence factor BrkB family protein [Actinospica sp.]|jgi:YihY family inner membrane protein|nr:YihY/virulence factor BrkB family protein [Actinospica sp.]
MPTLIARLDAAQRRMRPTAFVVAVLRKSSEDQAGYLAVLLSFYAFLAVFPLLLVLATVLGIVLRDHPGVQQDVIHSALTDFPVIGTQLRANVHSLNGSVFGLTVGLIGTVWGARGLSTCAQTACNTIWAIPYSRRPSVLRRQLRGLALLGVIVLNVMATGALSDLSAVGGGHPLWLEWTGAAATTVVNAVLFGLGFRLAIAREVRTREFVPAACATAVVWQALLSLGSYLVQHELRHAEDLYGVFGLVLGLLAWLHVQARVTVLLLEADCVRVRGLWPRTVDGPELVPGDKRAFDAYAAMQQRRPGDIRILVEYGPGTGDLGAARASEGMTVHAGGDFGTAPAGTATAADGLGPPRGAAPGGPGHGARPPVGAGTAYSTSSATGEAVVSHLSAGTRSSTPAKSTAPGSVPKARP